MLKTTKTPFVTELNHNKFIKKHDDVKREHKTTSSIYKYDDFLYKNPEWPLFSISILCTLRFFF